VETKPLTLPGYAMDKSGEHLNLADKDSNIPLLLAMSQLGIWL
jgi:hypothetical protein